MTGELIGYGFAEDLAPVEDEDDSEDERPRFKSVPKVRSDHGNEYFLPSVESMRLQDPWTRLGPAWTRLAEGLVVRPTLAEDAEFERLLSRRTPPGPSYIQLIEEIHLRGFDALVVGGTVRDVLAGRTSNDVDIVTSMPLGLGKSFLTDMYRGEPSISPKRGYLRLGGRPGNSDPFIDLKQMSALEPGTANALFGADVRRDVEFRDFCCNSVYYDAVNKVLIDPTGRGIFDAEDDRLHFTCSSADPYLLAQIAIRFIKFVHRGYIYTDETEIVVRGTLCDHLSGMDLVQRVRYIKAQLLSKHPKHKRPEVLEGIEETIWKLDEKFGFGAFWREKVLPYRDRLLK